MKLELIKQKLASLLAKFASIKTDKAILEYDGEELAVGIEVFIADENGERKPAEDGEYITEDEKKIVVADGKVVEIVEKPTEVEPEEEPAEEEPAEEEQPAEEEPAEDEIAKRFEEIETKLKELYSIVEKILDRISTNNEDVEARLSKIEKMSSAKPVVEEIETMKNLKKTGDAKVDRFLERYGK